MSASASRSLQSFLSVCSFYVTISPGIAKSVLDRDKSTKVYYGNNAAVCFTISAIERLCASLAVSKGVQWQQNNTVSKNGKLHTSEGGNYLVMMV